MITRIQNYNIEDVKRSIKYLLELSAKSELVRNHAVRISEHQVDKISAIYEWVKSNLLYVSDPVSPNGDDIELFISPVKQVEWFNANQVIAGDCDDHALLATALYHAIGLQSNVVLIDTEGKGFDHAYCEVWSIVLSQFISADTTAKFPLGWIPSYHNRLIIS